MSSEMEPRAILSAPVSPNTLEGGMGENQERLCRGMVVLPKLVLVFIFGSQILGTFITFDSQLT